MSLKMRVVGKIIKGVYEVVEEVYDIPVESLNVCTVCLKDCFTTPNPKYINCIERSLTILERLLLNCVERKYRETFRSSDSIICLIYEGQGGVT